MSRSQPNDDRESSPANSREPKTSGSVGSTSSESETHELSIRSMGRGGSGIALLPEGRAVRVPKTLPGEIVLARVYRGRFKTRAVLERVVVPSPDRVEAPCRHFASCDGCQIQHLSDAHQLAAKTDYVRRHLARALGDSILEVIEPTRPAPTALGYRARHVLRIEGGRIGFGATGGGFAPIDNCAIATSATNDLLVLLGRALATHTETSFHHVVLRAPSATARMVVFVGPEHPRERTLLEWLRSEAPELSLWLNRGSSRTHRVLGPEYHHVGGPARVVEEVGTVRLLAGPASFTQVNPAAAASLYAHARAVLRIGRDDDVLDLYCGSGALALHLSMSARRVLGVELDHLATEDALVAAKEAGITNVAFRTGRAERIARKLWIAGERFGVATVNPPRGGLDDGLVTHFSKLGVRRLAYVSCSPPTLARDLETLRAAGYEVLRVTPFDLFAQTYHVETVALLERV